jgi:hypothetical protein
MMQYKIYYGVMIFSKFLKHLPYLEYQVHTQNFLLLGGSDPEAIYNLCLILKIVL